MTERAAMCSSTCEPLDRRDAWCAALLAGAYLALVGGTLAWHGYWSDEFHTIRTVARPWYDLIQERASKGHPPLFFLTQKAWTRLAGHGEVADRALAMLCGLGTVLLTYRMARHEVGRSWASLAAVALALAGTQLLIVQLARSYALLQLLVTANAALVVAGGKPSAWRMAAAAALCAAAMFTHGSAMIAIPAQLAATLVAWPSRWAYVAAGAGGCLAYVPFWLAFPTIDNVETHLDWVPPPTVEALLRFPAMLQFGRQVVVVPLWGQIMTGLVLVGMALRALWRSDCGAFFGLQWFLAWAAAAAAGAMGVGIVAVERYFAAALVAQAMCIALSAEMLVKLRPKMGAVLVAGIAGGLAISTGLYLALPTFTPWREMAALVMARKGPGERVVAVSPAVLATPLAHYYDGQVEYRADDPITGSGSAPGIWILLREDSDEAALRVMPRDRVGWERMETYRFHRGRVLHLYKSKKPQANGPQ
jgi:hypothetical protein